MEVRATKGHGTIVPTVPDLSCTVVTVVGAPDLSCTVFSDMGTTEGSRALVLQVALSTPAAPWSQ